MPRFDVHLIRFGPAVTAPEQELRKVFPIDGDTARSIVAGLPKVVKRGATKEVAETIAKALRDLGAEVECKQSVAVTPVAGSIPPTASTPPNEPRRRMRATAVAGSFRPGDLLSSAPPPAESEAPKDVSLPPPGRVASEEGAIPNLTLDFGNVPSKRRAKGRRSAGSSAAPASSVPPPASGTTPDLELDAADDPGADVPSTPVPALEVDDLLLPGETSASRPATASQRPPAGPLGSIGAIELGTDAGQPARSQPPLAATSSPPVTTTSPPLSTTSSEAAAVERRDMLVAGVLLGAVCLGIGYRFATYVERPKPSSGDDESRSIDQRISLGEFVDAGAFIDEGGEIVTASRSRMNLRGLVDKLYDAGAKKVYAEAKAPTRRLQHGGLLVTTALVVELPGDDDALDPIVAEYAAWSGRLANTITLDELESHGLGPGYWRMRVDLEGM